MNNRKPANAPAPANAPEPASTPEPANTPEPAKTAIADKLAEMIAAAKAAQTIAKESDRRSGKEGPEPQRVAWPAEVSEAANAAGIRLPGLYPARQTQHSTGKNAWFRFPTKAARKGRPVRNDEARLIFWTLAGQQLATTGEVPLTTVLLAAAAAVAVITAEGANRIPEWTQYLVSEGMKNPEGKPVSTATCLLQQLSQMAGTGCLCYADRVITIEPKTVPVTDAMRTAKVAPDAAEEGLAKTEEN